MSMGRRSRPQLPRRRRRGGWRKLPRSPRRSRALLSRFEPSMFQASEPGILQASSHPVRDPAGPCPGPSKALAPTRDAPESSVEQARRTPNLPVTLPHAPCTLHPNPEMLNSRMHVGPETYWAVSLVGVLAHMALEYCTLTTRTNFPLSMALSGEHATVNCSKNSCSGSIVAIVSFRIFFTCAEKP